MRVLITRPESEATALAVALAGRGHATVIAPLFGLQFLRPPADFAAALASCQAVLVTSANGARALAEASEQRSKPVYAVGDTTAATAEGLGFTNVVSAAGDSRALAALGNTPDAFGQTWHLPCDDDRLTYKQFVAMASDVFGREASYTVIGKWAMTAAGLFSKPVREIRELLPRYEQDNLLDSTRFKRRFPEFKVTRYREGLELAGRIGSESPLWRSCFEKESSLHRYSGADMTSHFNH